MLNDDVIRLRELLEDARHDLRECQVRLVKIDKSIYWTKGTVEGAIWSGSCPHALERIAGTIERIDAFMGD